MSDQKPKLGTNEPEPTHKAKPCRVFRPTPEPKTDSEPESESKPESKPEHDLGQIQNGPTLTENRTKRKNQA